MSRDHRLDASLPGRLVGQSRAIRDVASAGSPAVRPLGEVDGARVLGPKEAFQRAHLAVAETPAPRSRYERFVKPAIDRVIGLILAIATLPLAIVVAAAVWVSMGAPVVFKQQRVGRGGEIFTVAKFRTMHGDRRASPMPFVGPDRRITHKSPEDPRLTPLGKFLRRWSLDEIPQFWNVVAGHMSLVGPRPELVGIVQKYEPWQHRRHLVKPGITGLWQTSLRGEVPMHEASELDIEYVESTSLWLDVKLLLLTVPIVLGFRKGF